MTTEDWGFLLVDFKKRSIISIESEFYGHSIIYGHLELALFLIAIVVGHRSFWVTSIFLHSGEGMTQGDPLAMITFGIGILPLIKNLRRDLPDINQPWYTDDSGALGIFARSETYFNFLTRQGPRRGYYPEQFKIIMIVCPDNLEAGKVFGFCQSFKV